MNSNFEPEPSLFEAQLETFSTRQLPEDWKSELISRAMDSTPSKRSALTTFHKLTTFCIGAAWILIAGLVVTTPTSESKLGGVVDEEVGEGASRIPELVHHLQNRRSLTEPFSLEL